MNPRTLTPVPNTIIVAVVICLLAGLIPINFLAEMTSIGTLVAFLVVSIGVMVLRRTHPELPRGFKVPCYPVTPILSILGCLWIIKDLRAVTIWVFLIWVAVALVWYFSYGFKHSHLGRHEHVGLIHDEDAAAMTMIVGYAPDERGKAALHLAAMLARSAGDDLVVCTVVPAPWVPGMARVDAEYREYLDAGRPTRPSSGPGACLPGDVPATFVRHSARSAPVGLLELAEEHERPADRARVVLGRGVRPHRPRQRDRPAAAQLAGLARPCPAGFPVPAGAGRWPG